MKLGAGCGHKSFHAVERGESGAAALSAGGAAPKRRLRQVVWAPGWCNTAAVCCLRQSHASPCRAAGAHWLPLRHKVHSTTVESGHAPTACTLHALRCVCTPISQADCTALTDLSYSLHGFCCRARRLELLPYTRQNPLILGRIQPDFATQALSEYLGPRHAPDEVAKVPGKRSDNQFRKSS